MKPFLEKRTADTHTHTHTEYLYMFVSSADWFIDAELLQKCHFLSEPPLRHCSLLFSTGLLSCFTLTFFFLNFYFWAGRLHRQFLVPVWLLNK